MSQPTIQQMVPEFLAIRTTDVQALMNYLVRLPYKEVAQFVQVLGTAAAVQPASSAETVPVRDGSPLPVAATE